MVFESIPNFDHYIVVSVVLFIIGLFSVMVYEKSGSSSSSSSADKQESKQRQSKTNTR